MQRKNIPTHVLAKGISKVGFEDLLCNIKIAVIDDGVNTFNNYSEMVELIKNNVKDSNDKMEVEEWLSNFETKVFESTKIINENLDKINELFQRMFDDWEKYKLENGIVEEESKSRIEEKNIDQSEIKIELDLVGEEPKEQLVKNDILEVVQDKPILEINDKITEEIENNINEVKVSEGDNNE